MHGKYIYIHMPHQRFRFYTTKIESSLGGYQLFKGNNALLIKESKTYVVEIRDFIIYTNGLFQMNNVLMAVAFNTQKPYRYTAI